MHQSEKYGVRSRIKNFYNILVIRDLTLCYFVSPEFVDMGHALSLSVISEGVETQAQSEFLKTKGSDSVQGLLYGRPVAVKEFEQYF